MKATFTSWQTINWSDVLRDVRRLQAEIVEAEQAGDVEQVRELQDRLVQSASAKLLAVRQVTTTNGRRSPGIDGRLWDTPERKMEAARSLDARNYRPQPARRVDIPKDSNHTRPLGILTMRDRAMQALYGLALDPVAETRADPHSYGFRKYRAATDAVVRCEEIVQQPERPSWILNADIEHCFDTISHDWLVQHIPLDAEMLGGWLKAGYLEKGQVYPTERGLPQGGMISPTLANMTLDGLEPLLEEAAARRRRTPPVYFVRYADDFVVLSSSKRWLRHTALPVIEDFLSQRGMRLSAQKTTLVHLKQGIEFLGYRLHYQRGILRVEPTRANFANVIAKIAALIRSHADAPPDEMIQRLTPIIRGWAEYYKHVEQRRWFVELDRQVADLLWAWAIGQQSGLLKRRRARQCFTTGPGNLRLLTDQAGHTLHCAQETPLIRHIPIDPACNPYDPAWQAYLKQRRAT